MSGDVRSNVANGCECGCWDYQDLRAAYGREVALADQRAGEAERLRAALEDMTEYVRLGMTWIADTDRHVKMKRAWERGREALETDAIRRSR